MTAPSSDAPLSVVCVDDNTSVVNALRDKLTRTPGFIWKGHAGSADELIPLVQRECPCLVILDLDMPGRSPFDALQDLARECPNARVVIFSGHVRQELIDQALNAGAWGFVSKNDGENALIDALRRVAQGEFVLSTEVRVVVEG